MTIPIRIQATAIANRHDINYLLVGARENRKVGETIDTPLHYEIRRI